jgi:hypothetical protein
MKKFITYILFFLVSLFLFIFIIFISTSFIERKHSNFKIKSNPKYIVIGHSHPECAYNDSLIPNFKNLAQSGESYFYSYFKTKEIIKQNPSIEFVFIEFTNNQINSKMDQWIWGDKYLSHRYPKYSSFMSFLDNFLLIKNNPSGFMNSMSVSTKTKLEKIIGDEIDVPVKVGGYLHLERNKTDSIVKSINSSNKRKDSFKIEISKNNLLYLSKLIDFCKENGKKVVLLRSPLHDKYPGYINEKKYNSIIKKKYGDIEYLDFSKFPLSNNEFGDLEHINYKGAKKFSEWFAILLKNGLLEKSEKQNYIDNEIIKIKRD